MITLEQKKAIVGEVAEVAARSPAAIVSEYIGLNVADMTELRASAREAGVYLKVVRNTLARRAVEGTQFECLQDQLEGPLLWAFSNEEPGSAAKVIRDFRKKNSRLVVKLVAADGKLRPVEDVERLASMPSIDDARAMFLGLLQAPLGRFVRVLSEPEAKFARLLAARRDQQEAA